MNAWARLVLRARLRRKPYSLTLQHGPAAGQTMTTAQVAIPVRDTSKGRGKDARKVFNARLVAWGEMAETLARHEADDIVEAAGELRYSEYMNPKTQTLERNWECAVERLTSRRTEGGREEEGEGKESVRIPSPPGEEAPSAPVEEPPKTPMAERMDPDDLDAYIDELLAEAKAAAAQALESGESDPDDEMRADVERLLAERKERERSGDEQ